MNRDKKILVIGIGSEYRSDDRVGIEIARSLKTKILQNVEIVVESGDVAALMERWNEAETVILIDAVSSGTEPGNIHRIDVNKQQIPSAFFHSSTHAFGIAEAVEIARSLHQLPSQIIIYGIEGSNFGVGSEVSFAVHAAIEPAVRLIIDEIKSLTDLT